MKFNLVLPGTSLANLYLYLGLEFPSWLHHW